MIKILKKYNIEVDSVPAIIEILEDDKETVPIYKISMPELDPGTKSLINTLIDELAQKIPLEVEEVTDPKKIQDLKTETFNEALEYIKAKFPEIKRDNINLLVGLLIHKMYGLGEYELFLADEFLEEIVINNSNTPIAVYHKEYGWLKTNKKVESNEDIYNIASQVGRKVNRTITSLNPIMDAHLISGDRVASTLFPISTMGNSITIRKFARSPWNLINLIKGKTMSKEIAALLWLAIQYELSIMVIGGTASGKTSVLNALSALIPPTQRVISIEDTREISLPYSLHWNWVPLTSRTANPEGQGEVSMLDLMVSSLRMRPDRIIVGEVRRKEQAETMFEAMHTGHSVYTTMHADTVQQIIRRLLEPPFAIPKTEFEALQLILGQFRDRRKNIRRTLELAEVLPGGKETLDINYLYRWHPRTDSFEKINSSIRVYEDLNLHTGMTLGEIDGDLQKKQAILQWLMDYDFKNIDNLGKIFKVYYKKPETIINAAKNNKNPDEVIEEG